MMAMVLMGEEIKTFLMFRSLSSRLSCKSSQPSSSSITEHQSTSFSNKVFKEEINFEDINQELDNWEIPKISPKELYKPDGSFFHRSDYIIRTVEQKFKLKSDDEKIHLLSEKSIKEHLSKKYNYMHIGSVQIGLKPLTRGSLDVAVLLCLRDIRHNRFHDSLLGTVESSLSHGPIFFNCFPDLTISLDDKNILDVLFLNVKLHGYDMKEGSVPITLVYRVQYKVMNSIRSNFLKTKCDKSGETTLFLTDETKANVIVPKTIQWSDITLPEKWALEKATPALPRISPEFQDIIQHQAGTVELVFNRRNSFSMSRSTRSDNPTMDDFRTAVSRRSFSIPRSIHRSEQTHDDSTIHLQGLEPTTPVRPTYQRDEDEQRTVQSPTFSSLNEPYDVI
jgi:hypothetical protein